MVDDVLVEYVRTCVSQGYAHERIKEQLLRSGYSVPETEEAMELVLGPNINKAQPKPTPIHIEHKPENKKSFDAVTIFMVFLLILAGVGLVFFFMQF
jgi:hypothetical protein